jgi:hypothetical protein
LKDRNYFLRISRFQEEKSIKKKKRIGRFKSISPPPLLDINFADFFYVSFKVEKHQHQLHDFYLLLCKRYGLPEENIQEPLFPQNETSNVF